MSTSDSSYQFTSSTQGSSWMSHETQPLELLGLVNKGNPRVSDNQVRLQRMPINASSTFERLANDRTSFANPSVCVEDDRFVVHFSECIVLGINELCAHCCAVVRNHPLSGLASFDGIPGRHVCLSARLYWQFYSDSQSGDGSSEVPSCDSICVTDVPEAVRKIFHLTTNFYS